MHDTPSDAPSDEREHICVNITAHIFWAANIVAKKKPIPQNRLGASPEGRGGEHSTPTGTIDKEENHPIMCVRVSHVRAFDRHLSGVLYSKRVSVCMTTMVIPMAGHCPANPLAVQTGTSPKAVVKLDAH
ncbi:Uncharacterized protein DBV15_06519 [Temnothorax longispinosus]|uniref:Uncharacterized protein n=1 Tax=Temnothorax longispinosus TaxID=300112 RepID=A0A4S2KA53_9HYME|nr:Uncharacterized protein DBV15_06519 [Temnothorax longispinosus]